LHERQGTALPVTDSLARFLPAHSENSARALLDCLTPLQRLATAGMSVLLPHHARRIGDLDPVAHASGFYFGMDCIAHTNFAHTHLR
jgi:hypothetical protein